MGGKLAENLRSRSYCKFLGVIWLAQDVKFPEAVFDKEKAYPTPKNELQGFVGIWELLEDFYFLPGTVP